MNRLLGSHNEILDEDKMKMIVTDAVLIISVDWLCSTLYTRIFRGKKVRHLWICISRGRYRSTITFLSLLFLNSSFGLFDSLTFRNCGNRAFFLRVHQGNTSTGILRLLIHGQQGEQPLFPSIRKLCSNLGRKNHLQPNCRFFCLLGPLLRIFWSTRWSLAYLSPTGASFV